MQLQKKYLLKNRIKSVQDIALQELLSKFIRYELYLINLWSYPYTKKITLVSNDLELAFKLNIYDNINVIYLPSNKIEGILKQEWIREYFVSQMPEFMVCDIVTLIENGETPEEAWDYLVNMWLPENKTAKQILELQYES